MSGNILGMTDAEIAKNNKYAKIEMSKMKKLAEIKATKITNQLRRAMLFQEVQNLEYNIEHAEMRIPEALKQLQKLKPTKKELEEGVQELFDTYLI